VSLVCVPITVHDLAPALADAHAARDGGADLVEFRIDECFSGSGDEREERLVQSLVADSPLPCIVTCRSVAEGGSYDGDEMERVSLLERLVLGPGVVHPPRFIDVELGAYVASANIRQKIDLAVRHPAQVREVDTSLILSIHDFGGRPVDLSRRLLKACEEPAAAVVKVAFRARSLHDALELLDLPANLARPVIALGMGEFGVVTRLLAGKFGGLLTFASLRPSSATAPGQPTLKDLLETYRFRAVRRSTKVYGIVGFPVTHSRSPAVHNAGFEALGIDACYVPLPVGASPDDPQASYASFKGAMAELIAHPRLDLRGCSITLPHKEHALRLATESGWRIDPIAVIAGAANTLVIDRSGDEPAVTATNTDAPAIVARLEAAMGPLAGRSVAIVGAGGVARAAAAACLLAGARVHLFNRTLERAARLAAELRARIEGAHVGASTLDALATHACDALVQATSMGMESGDAAAALAAPLEAMASLNPAMVVLETVYTPVRTPLVAEARRLNLRCITGLEVFVDQAERQFEGWTGRPAPEGLFARVASPAAPQDR
jgi:3-dehydroquinate dehydratase/shikimate dehydrogenase